MADFILEYHNQIKNGTVTVGNYIKILYDMIQAKRADGSYVFNEQKAMDAVDWFEKHCFHCEGDLAPGNIELELWQKAMLSCVFGLMDPTSGKRQFREIVLIVARKNGKSLISAGIGKYVWYLDGGYGARVYCIAPKLDQADIIYNDIWQMVLLDPDYTELKEAIDGSKNEHNKKTMDDSALPRHTMTDLRIRSTNSTVKKIAFSSKKSDGFNPSLTICDEIASWSGDQGLKQYEVMKSGMGARSEGLILSCSTAGYINDSIYDELIKRSTRFLMGESKEQRLLPFLYIIDDVAKWNDIEELKKSNPNLDVSVSTEYMLEEIAVAEGSLSKKTEFITKYCNVKQNSSLAWLSTDTIEKCCGDPLDLEQFRGCYCVGGIDLSRTTDLTSACVVIQKDKHLYVFSKFWLPSEKIQDAIARDGVPYNIYIQRGLLQPSGDNFVDYDDCYKWFTDLVEQYEIYPLEVGYDRYNALQLTQKMEQYGFHMDDVFQGFNLTPVINEMEGLMKDGIIHIGDNDLLKVHLLDSALKIDAETAKSKLIKLNHTSHVDGTAALLDAMCVRQKWWGDLEDRLANDEV